MHGRCTFVVRGLRGAIASAACALFLTDAANAQPAASEPGLPMWVVRDADSTIYITGTVHLLRDGMEWRSPKLDAAFAEADELRLEVAEVGDPDALAAKLEPLLAAYAAYDGEPLTSLLSEEENARLVEVLKEADAPEDIFDKIDTLQPWFTTFTLGRERSFTDSVYKTSNGIDVGLAKMARERGIPILGMEDAEVQVALMAGGPISAQLAQLRSSLFPSPSLQRQGERLADLAFGNWLRGETNSAEALIVFMQFAAAATGQSSDPLFKDRNEAWAAGIEEMLKGSGVAFIAVGAGHLVGSDSLQARLKLRGIKSERY